MVQDATGNLSLADAGQGRIFRITPDGIATTIVGDGPLGRPRAMPKGKNAYLPSPRDWAFDFQGQLNVSETYCQCIRRISSDGIISTVYTLPKGGVFRYFEAWRWTRKITSTPWSIGFAGAESSPLMAR